MSKDNDLRDLFLDDNLLIELAKRELKGRRPPVIESERLPVSAIQLKNKLMREIEARGWSARDLALQAGLTQTEAHALIKGGQRISPELAVRLGRVFATSSEYWLREDD
ncbi:MAG: hypothetical protein RJB13_1091 [Pseudomonadota bacterium]|jgi:hypothetical protein